VSTFPFVVPFQSVPALGIALFIMLIATLFVASLAYVIEVSSCEWSKTSSMCV
jgi:hypothetical protein